MQSVHCESCVHLRTAPYQVPITGCYHPDNMKSKQKVAYLKQQELPGDHEKINLRHDCAQFEARPEHKSIWKRMLSGLAG